MKRRCELCNGEIPQERLQALPETRRCFECARTKGSDVHARKVDLSMDPETYKDLLGAMRN